MIKRSFKETQEMAPLVSIASGVPCRRRSNQIGVRAGKMLLVKGAKKIKKKITINLEGNASIDLRQPYPYFHSVLPQGKNVSWKIYTFKISWISHYFITPTQIMSVNSCLF